MRKLNENKILNLVLSRMYYDEMGNIKNNIGISEINIGSNHARINLEDGRSFKITIEAYEE